MPSGTLDPEFSPPHVDTEKAIFGKLQFWFVRSKTDRRNGPYHRTVEARYLTVRKEERMPVGDQPRPAENLFGPA
jgi:hypothetical protein